MKKSALFLSIAMAFPIVSYATGGGVKPKPTPKPPVSQPITNYTTAVGNGGYGAGGAGGAGGYAESGSSSQAVSGAGAQSAAQIGTVGNSLNVEMKGSAYAPDVIAYPTAPCRVAFGASGGGITAVFGLSGSILDEACSRIETSRHLHNLGHQAAAVQIMCLSDEARKALEVTGVKCMIAPQATAEPIRP
jgi:hypothetical protein